MANYFQIFSPLVFSYRVFIFANRGNFQARTSSWDWRKFAAENRVKEGIGQESNGAANQEKQIFLLCQISPSASSTRDMGTRLDLCCNLGRVHLGSIRNKNNWNVASKRLFGSYSHSGKAGFPFRLFCSQKQKSRNIFRNIFLFRNIPNERALDLRIFLLDAWWPPLFFSADHFLFWFFPLH